MSKTNVNKANKANVSATNVKADDQKAIKAINLNQFADRLSTMEIKEKSIKETLYIYPEGWNKAKINSDEGKKYRSSIRRALDRFCNNIFVFTKTQNVEGLKKEIDAFDEFYKKNYQITDYTVKSITNSSNKVKDVEFMLEIIKASKA